MIIDMDVPVTLKTEWGIAFGRVFRLQDTDTIFLRTDRKLDTGERFTLKMELMGVSIPFTADMKVAKIGTVSGVQRTYQCVINDVTDSDKQRYEVWLETQAKGGSSMRPDLVVEDVQEGFDYRMTHSDDAETRVMMENIDATMGRESETEDAYGFDMEDEGTEELTDDAKQGLLSALHESLAQAGAEAQERATAATPAQVVEEADDAEPDQDDAPSQDEDSWLGDLSAPLDGDMDLEGAERRLEALLAADLEGTDDDATDDAGAILDSIEDDEWDDDEDWGDLTEATVDSPMAKDLYEDDDTASLAAPEFPDDRDVPDDFDFGEETVDDPNTLSDLVDDPSLDRELLGDESDSGDLIDDPSLDRELLGDLYQDELSDHLDDALSEEEPGLAELLEESGDAELIDDDDSDSDSESYSDSDSESEEEPALGELLEDSDEVPAGFSIAAQDDFAAVLEEEAPPPAPAPPRAAPPQDPVFQPADGGVTVRWRSLESFARDFDQQLKKKRLRIESKDAPAPGTQVTVWLHLPDQQVLALRARLAGSDLDGYDLKLELPLVTKGKLKRTAHPPADA
jgi:hypothetical protein